MNISALGAGETPRSLFALGKGENFRQKVIETGQGKCYYDILMKTAPLGLSPAASPGICREWGRLPRRRGT